MPESYTYYRIRLNEPEGIPEYWNEESSSWLPEKQSTIYVSKRDVELPLDGVWAEFVLTEPVLDAPAPTEPAVMPTLFETSESKSKPKAPKANVIEASKLTLEEVLKVAESRPLTRFFWEFLVDDVKLQEAKGVNKSGLPSQAAYLYGQLGSELLLEHIALSHASAIPLGASPEILTEIKESHKGPQKTKTKEKK